MLESVKILCSFLISALTSSCCFCRSAIDELIFVNFVKHNMHSENFLVNDVCFYYKSQSEKESVDKILHSLMNCIIDYVDDSEHKINVLNIVENSLDLSPLFFEKSKFRA